MKVRVKTFSSISPDYLNIFNTNLGIKNYWVFFSFVTSLVICGFDGFLTLTAPNCSRINAIVTPIISTMMP